MNLTLHLHNSINHISFILQYFILDTIQFEKEGFQNRNKIRIKNSLGWQWLTIPILLGKKKLINLSDIKIDDKAGCQQ